MTDVVAKGGTTLYLGPEYVTAFLDAKGNRMSGTLDSKDPLESKNYFLDMTAWMQALGTVISEVDGAIVTPDDSANVGTNQQSSYVVRVLVNGGAAGQDVKIVVPFSTADGQDLFAVIHVPIRKK